MTHPANLVPSTPAAKLVRGHRVLGARRRNAPSALQEARDAALCKALGHVTGAVVARVDGRRWMTGVQPAWEAYTGQGAELAFGSGFLDAVHEGDRERLQHAWAASADNPRPRLLEVEVRVWNALAGRHQLCAWQALPLEIVPGRADEWLVLLRDAQHTALSVDDLRMDPLRTLARGIAHQLNNLLHGVMLHAAVIGRHLSADSLARSSLQHVLRLTEHGAEFGRHLLAFSGSASSAGSSELSEVLASMQGVLSSLCGPNARLEFALERGLGLVVADVPRLQHVALSLVKNAVDALGNGQGTIHVRTLRRELSAGELGGVQPSGADPGPYVCLDVVDDGPGISEAVRSRIFEPFYANKATGRGLGLPSVLGIVRTWGGFVQVRSEPGHGTCVRVLLPSARGTERRRITQSDGALGGVPVAGHGVRSRGCADACRV